MHVIGVLCNRSNQKRIIKYFRSRFKSYKHDKGTAVVIFTVDDINTADRTVYGYIVNDRKVIYSKTSLPLLVFNLSVQYKKQNIKKIRGLTEIEGMSLINEANQYNQSYIMDILESSKEIKKYILPHVSCSVRNISDKLPEKDNILLKTENGADFSKLIYINNLLYKSNIVSKYDCVRCRTHEIQDILGSITSRKKWVLLETPDLMTSANQILVVRAYMQKCTNGDWMIVSKTIYPEIGDNEASKKMNYDSKGFETINPGSVDFASVKIAEYINCFISDLGICFIDFIFDKHKTPYFLGLGGWDGRAYGKQSRSISVGLCQNIIDYAAMSIIQERRG